MARRVLFGTTWWGKQWIDALNHLDYQNRLPRGRTYFNTGRIDEMKFNPKTLKVEAIAHGSAYYPYEVSIILNPMPKEDVEKLADAIAERPALLAKLLEGELDPEVGSLAQTLGISLFPKSWKEFRMSCTCPDSAVPCKHIAGVYYGMVKTIDADPMWVFYFRGVDLPGLLRQRGIDLDKSVTLSEPEPLAWMALPDPEEDGTSCKTQGLPELSDVPEGYVKRIASLLPACVEDKKALARSRYEKLVNTVMARAKSHDGQDHDAEQLWSKFQAAFTGGRVLPDLVWSDGRFVLGLRTPRGRRLGASMLDRSRLVIALAELCGRAPEFSPGLAPWAAVARVAVDLIKLGALAPVLVHVESGDRDKVAALWVPALQAEEVRRYVVDVGRLLDEGILEILKKSGCPLDESTRTGRAFTLLSVFMTEYVEFAACIPASFAGDPLYMLMAKPLSSMLDYGIAQADITLVRKFLKPLSLGLMQLAWVPVMTVRTAKDGNVTLNLGVVARDAAAKARPVLYRDVLKESKFEADRLAILSVFEVFATYCTELRAVLDSKGKPATLARDGLRDFLFDAVPSLEMLGARVMLPKSLQRLLKPQLSVSVSGEGGAGKGMITKEAVGQFDWQVSIGGQAITPEEFEKLMAHAGEVIPFKEEFVYLDPALLKKLKAQVDFMEGAGYLDMMKAVYTGQLDDGLQVSVPEHLLERVRELGRVDAMPIPSGLQATLRPYQERGYSWLMRNLTLGLGALIADDMGLGKTVQAIAFLLSRAQHGASLVVMPTSVLLNWEREIKRFAPSLRPVIFNREDRAEVVKTLDAGDVLLSTYGLLPNEIENLKTVDWNVIVLDEAHTIKSKETKTSKAAMELTGDARLLLTGTPLQNHLSELWNLSEFANPGLLGGYTSFVERFVVPVEKLHDKERQRLLKRMISPFLLRRTKTDVLEELPEKTDITLRVELSEAERALYEGLRENTAKALETGEIKPMEALAALMKLRQAACHPQLVNPKLAMGSSKTDAFLELVDELRSNGHRALVFSQFTSHLALIRKALDERGIEYLYLDGAVSAAQRTKLTESFRLGSMPLFLISLKAGGTGLNLTAADYVIHLDPWWNPAIEDQASDRAYRIGQERPVTVYRLVAEGTIEEKILRLHDTKRSLADALLEGADMSSRLSKEMLLGLLSNQADAD